MKIFDQIRKLIKKYQILRIQVKNFSAYEIVDIENKNTIYKILVRINGTGKIVSFFPHEIATEDSFLEQFSTKDIRTILYFYYEDQKKARYKIISQKFSSNGEDMFCFKNHLSNKIEEIFLKDLLATKEIIKHCSSEDAFKIGYYSGRHHSERN